MEFGFCVDLQGSVNDNAKMRMIQIVPATIHILYFWDVITPDLQNFQGIYISPEINGQSLSQAKINAWYIIIIMDANMKV